MGLHHFGFWVEDTDRVRELLAEQGAEHCENRPAGATTAYFEEKYGGPDSVIIDISEHGWQGARPPTDVAAQTA